jgi:ABC-2 type transport system permease protein
MKNSPPWAVNKTRTERIENVMETVMRQTWAFLFRGYHITRRYIGWVIVFNFYALVTSATVALIGVAAKDYQMTLTLVVGALLWNYLSWLYNEIAMSIAYERWEGTLEYTFMAPVARSVHLLGVSLFSLLNSILTSVIVLLGLIAFTNLNLRGANLLGVMVVLVVSTLAFVGLGLFAAVFPVMSAERGAEATHIFQGSLLLVSGVYYPIDVLPGWMQPLSAISPATYTLSACRKLFGVGNAASTPELLAGAPLSAVTHELLILALMGAILLPLGLMTFVRVEAWAKRTGKLKRTG